MSNSASGRRERVLRAIVSDYIAQQEPVGSKALVERHGLKVSSATIRNDMAVLEAEGLIAQTHASSGRIPTEKGYREFVDSIQTVKPLSKAERAAIMRFLDQGVDLEDVLRRGVQLLSQLTRQVAMVQVPTLQVSRVKHVEVVGLTPTRILLVLITDTGRVDQRNVELTELVGEDVITEARAVLNEHLVGKSMPEARGALEHAVADARPEAHDVVEAMSRVLLDTLVDAPSDRLILAGTPYLTQLRGELPAGLPAVLEALEEQVIMLKLMSAVHELGQVKVSIGEENEDQKLHGASVVATAYGQAMAPLGALGTVGPTYMDYSGTISKVTAVAHYVSKVLGS
ncbi:heat-inducible transcriptional repressor HrcA [Corynebacterium glucuronolyticum]|uniref:Heat-inducible transcription repressor HrcA n=1 Tax=Corynebacterium glucuronolyticum TaxID=39791 RepID=A0A7T4EHJ3_9CORY|nr:heat-inducible transcriptional repressor HrcA [Corynebacterium glucuronolyticum]QQB47513.1 heat-inducible transcriptional repressor HrcA [Corynebacterium glucuronolyticum]WKD64134.1 Heat-inducible transcription repressor HrcA [Corynebacterium glucuronolyticum DSM 44120]SMB84867.1 heat-inducible transcription repressor HrcA [Corynebacterium glucuronolyticum]